MTQPVTLTIPQAIAHAQELLRVGRAPEAEVILRQILSADPRHADAMHTLGIIAFQARKPAEALEWIKQANAIAPTPISLNNHGELLRLTGRAAEALPLFQAAVARQPDYHDAWFNLGQALSMLRRHDDALKAWQKALALQPSRIDTMRLIANALVELRDFPTAATTVRRVIDTGVPAPIDYAILSQALSSMSRFDESIHAAEQGVKLSPGLGSAHSVLARALDAAGRLDDGHAEHACAAEFDPSSLHLGNLAACHEREGDLEQAQAEFAKAADAIPPYAPAVNALSHVARQRRDYSTAVSAAERAVQLFPNDPDAHGHLSLALLSVGDYQRGFAEYEWRWRCTDFTTRPRDFGRPMWDGSDPAGRRILVHAEQGFGDSFQFARFIPMLARRGATVIFECHHLIRPLMSRMEGVSKAIVIGTALPPFDLHAPLLSLPRAFGTTLDHLPNDVPYLSADPSRVDAWRQKFANLPGKKIGLVWGGNLKPDARRSMKLADLRPLAAIPGVSWISLQVSDHRKEIPGVPELHVVDPGDDLKDFSETAAALANLDLLITIDTGIAHLSGAMGIPTFTLLAYSPDWRWLADENRSPWYPTMRLFRQPTAGDWSDVVSRLVPAVQESVTTTAAR